MPGHGSIWNKGSLRTENATLTRIRYVPRSNVLCKDLQPSRFSFPFRDSEYSLVTKLLAGGLITGRDAYAVTVTAFDSRRPISSPM